MAHSTFLQLARHCIAQVERDIDKMGAQATSETLIESAKASALVAVAEELGRATVPLPLEGVATDRR